MLLVSLHVVAKPSHTKSSEFDVVIVGSTFSGIAAAMTAADGGHSVAIFEEYNTIGGLMTGGLSFTDFISYESLGGIFLAYTHRVEQYYIGKYGKKSEQVIDSHGGIHAEPHVTLHIFNEMLAAYPKITVYRNHRLAQVSLGMPVHGKKSIEGVTFKNTVTDTEVAVKGTYFIDATYEGDLAAYSGAEYGLGRESRDTYGEFLAGNIFYQYGSILPGSTGKGDHRIQAYNFRVILTNRSTNRLPIDKPKNYDRKTYLGIAKVLKEKKVGHVFIEKTNDGIFRTQMLPNQKADINDIKNAPVRMALLGQNYGYPEGSNATRQTIIEAHKNHLLGMLYFVQNDSSVPEKFRKEALEWGLPKDEFVENEHFPTRLYIREARRILGEYVFTQNDVATMDDAFIVTFKPNAVAIGDYALNCHGVAPATLHPSVADGDFNYIPPPFQIPAGVLYPVGFNNLLVSVAISSSHVGFSGLRLEPTWTALGEAAGTILHLALKNGNEMDKVDIAEVQEYLHLKGAKTTYISDLEKDSEFFVAAQNLGSKGFMHDLYYSQKEQMPGTKTYQSIRGTQYAYAYPFHKLEADKKVDSTLANVWMNRISDPEIRKRIEAYITLQHPTRGMLVLKMYEELKKNKVQD